MFLRYSVNRLRFIFANKFFIETADSNYLLARYTKINNILPEFFWQAAQSLEKYMKAGLILNGVSVKNEGHDLNKLWCNYKEVYHECPILAFKRPDQLAQELWSERSLDQFIKHINMYGSTECRYGLTSFNTSPSDLFQLDLFIHELKRRAIGLDWIVGRDMEPKDGICNFRGKTYAEVISEKIDFCPTNLAYIKGNNMGISLSIEDAYFSWNFSHINKSYPLHDKCPASVGAAFGQSYTNPLYWFYDWFLKNPHNQKMQDWAIWMMSMIKFSDDDIISLSVAANICPLTYLSKSGKKKYEKMKQN